MTVGFLKASRRLWARRLRYRNARLKKAEAARDGARIQKWRRLVATAQQHVRLRDAQIKAKRPTLDPAALRHVQPMLSRSRARDLARALGPAFRKFGITTPERAAAAVAQFAHESAGFSTTTEFASGAEYEGRGDLGNTHPGDGVRFKGRGYIQVTGRSNFTAASRALGHDFVGHPEDMAKPRWAAEVSCWWWQAHGCNDFADRGDFVGLTRRINGGLNGLASRELYWARAKQVAKGLVP